MENSRTLFSSTTGAEHRRVTQRAKKRTSRAVEASFRCPVCDKTFASDKYVRMHLGIHRQMVADVVHETQQDFFMDGGGHVGVISASGHVWECGVCGKCFHQASYYRNHIRTHSEERPFVCDLCSIGFKERYHLKKHHLFKHTKEMNEQCRECGKRFKDSTAVRAHERIHSDARPFVCQRCGKAFKTSECLWHHDHRSRACTGPTIPQQQDPRRDLTTIGASQAERRVAQTEIGVSELSRVLPVDSSRLSGQSNFRCSQIIQDQNLSAREENAGFRFSSSSLSSLASNESYEGGRSHEKSEGNSEETLLKEEVAEWRLSASSFTSGYSACDEAGKTSPLIASHNRSNTNSINASSSSSSCAVGKRWLEKRSSEEEVEVEQRKRVTGRIACVRCGKHFASSRAFEKHARLHNELRPHRCTVCDVGFKLKVHLKKHNLYRHNADYPCKCTVCGKGFKDTSAVRLHERIHSDERPFLCPCGKAFKTRENLWGHRHRLKHNTELRRPAEDSSTWNSGEPQKKGRSTQKTELSPSDANQTEAPSRKASINYQGKGNDKPYKTRDCCGSDIAKDFVKTEATGDCLSRVENSNHNIIDGYGKSLCWTRDIGREEMKVVPEQLTSTPSVGLTGSDDQLVLTPTVDSLRSSDEQRCSWSGSRDVIGNSLPSFETLISALRSCVGNWQDAGALSPPPLPHNGDTVDFLLGTKGSKQPAISWPVSSETIAETKRKGTCGRRRALIQRFVQSQELCRHGASVDCEVAHLNSHSLNTGSDKEGKCCNNILSVTWQHIQQLQ